MGVESFGVWLDGELERAKLNRAGLAALVGALGIRMSLKWIARTKTPPPS